MEMLSSLYRVRDFSLPIRGNGSSRIGKRIAPHALPQQPHNLHSTGSIQARSIATEQPSVVRGGRKTREDPILYENIPLLEDLIHF